MKHSKLQALYWLLSLTCSLSLMLLLSACDLFGGGNAARPTPTPSSSRATSTGPSLPSGSLTTYTGDGYTIGYPQGWTVKDNGRPSVGTGSGKSVTFTDPTGLISFTIIDTANPNGIIPTSTLLDAGLAALKAGTKNYQTVNVAQKTTVDGQSWDQRAGTADVTAKGVTVNTKDVALAVDHPASSPDTKVYAIVYGTTTVTFDATNTLVFQPMLQSFKFA